MYAAGYFREEGARSYVLVEPPSFFILTVNNILVMSYGFCVYCLKNSVPQERVFTYFWIGWAAFTFMLYLFMAVIIILMSKLDNEDTVTIECFGRQVTVSHNTTVETIRIAYHSFLLFLAIVSSICILALGKELQNNLQTKSLSILSLISCCSVLTTSVLWVAYSAKSGSTPYFVIPLWFCECPLLLATCFIVRPSKQESGDGSTYARSKGSRSSAQ
jgi:hypothetical protein